MVPAGTIRRAGVHGAEPGGGSIVPDWRKSAGPEPTEPGGAGGDEGAPLSRFSPEERPPQVAYRICASDGGQGPADRASARGMGGGPWGAWGARPGGKPFPA